MHISRCATAAAIFHIFLRISAVEFNPMACTECTLFPIGASPSDCSPSPSPLRLDVFISQSIFRHPLGIDYYSDVAHAGNISHGNSMIQVLRLLEVLKLHLAVGVITQFPDHNFSEETKFKSIDFS